MPGSGRGTTSWAGEQRRRPSSSAGPCSPSPAATNGTDDGRQLRDQRHEPPSGSARPDGRHAPGRDRGPGRAWHRHRRPSGRARGLRDRLPAGTRAGRSAHRGAGGDPRPVGRRAGLETEPVLPARGRRCASDSRAAPADHRRWRDTGGARLAARVGDGWTGFSDNFTELEPIYREALEAAGRRRVDSVVVLGVQGEGGWRPGDSLRASPWVEQPLEELARWRALGADGVVVQARTPADVDALVRAAERW